MYIHLDKFNALLERYNYSGITVVDNFNPADKYTMLQTLNNLEQLHDKFKIKDKLLVEAIINMPIEQQNDIVTQLYASPNIDVSIIAVPELTQEQYNERVAIANYNLVAEYGNLIDKGKQLVDVTLLSNPNLSPNQLRIINSAANENLNQLEFFNLQGEALAEEQMMDNLIEQRRNNTQAPLSKIYHNPELELNDDSRELLNTVIIKHSTNKYNATDFSEQQLDTLLQIAASDTVSQDLVHFLNPGYSIDQMNDLNHSLTNILNNVFVNDVLELGSGLLEEYSDLRDTVSYPTIIKEYVDYEMNKFCLDMRGLTLKVENNFNNLFSIHIVTNERSISIFTDNEILNLSNEFKEINDNSPKFSKNLEVIENIIQQQSFGKYSANDFKKEQLELLLEIPLYNEFVHCLNPEYSVLDIQNIQAKIDDTHNNVFNKNILELSEQQLNDYSANGESSYAYSSKIKPYIDKELNSYCLQIKGVDESLLADKFISSFIANEYPSVSLYSNSEIINLSNELVSNRINLAENQAQTQDLNSLDCAIQSHSSEKYTITDFSPDQIHELLDVRQTEEFVHCLNPRYSADDIKNIKTQIKELNNEVFNNNFLNLDEDQLQEYHEHYTQGETYNLEIKPFINAELNSYCLKIQGIDETQLITDFVHHFDSSSNTMFNSVSLYTKDQLVELSDKYTVQMEQANNYHRIDDVFNVDFEAEASGFKHAKVFSNTENKFCICFDTVEGLHNAFTDSGIPLISQSASSDLEKLHLSGDIQDYSKLRTVSFPSAELTNPATTEFRDIKHNLVNIESKIDELVKTNASQDSIDELKYKSKEVAVEAYKSYVRSDQPIENLNLIVDDKDEKRVLMATTDKIFFTDHEALPINHFSPKQIIAVLSEIVDERVIQVSKFEIEHNKTYEEFNSRDEATNSEHKYIAQLENNTYIAFDKKAELLSAVHSTSTTSESTFQLYGTLKNSYYHDNVEDFSKALSKNLKSADFNLEKSSDVKHELTTTLTKSASIDNKTDINVENKNDLPQGRGGR